MTTTAPPSSPDGRSPGGPAPAPPRAGRVKPPPRDWDAIRTLMRKDITAVRRSKAITIPMALVPAVLLLAMPLALGSVARSVDPGRILNDNPILNNLLGAIAGLPSQEQLPVLILAYLLSPLLVVIPLMVSAVLAADAFAGEKERRTLESLLHLPIADRDLFLAKVLGAFVPALAITWLGAIVYAIVANVSAWPATGRPILPFAQWTVLMIWVAPAVALLSLGLLVLVSSRAKTTQAANQLGGAVILPLIFVAASQVAPILLAPLWGVFLLGVFTWAVAIGLVLWGSRKFTRDRLAASS